MGTAHFKDSEFACRHCGQGGDQMNPILLNLLEKLRENIGGYSLKINCGYRCPEHNAEVRGAQFSQHVLFNAADVAVPSALSVMEMKWYALQVQDEEGHHFTGIGVYAYDPTGNTKGDGFIHLDVRNDGYGEVSEWKDLG